jgi:ammonium transporter, Amt family
MMFMSLVFAGTQIPSLLFAGYQMMFAVIAPALITGAFADRVMFTPYLIFIV